MQNLAHQKLNVLVAVEYLYQDQVLLLLRLDPGQRCRSFPRFYNCSFEKGKVVLVYSSFWRKQQKLRELAGQHDSLAYYYPQGSLPLRCYMEPHRMLLL